MFLTVLGGLLLLITVAAGLQVAFGNRKILFLRDIVPPRADAWPTLSVVFAARNEARAIEAAVRSMLALDYPDLEIVAVDDRSEDATGEILDRLAAEDARLRVHHVRALPAGWLGKNHALHAGAALAQGEFILFTDADILYHPQAMRGALHHAAAQKLDHLAVIPELLLEGQMLPMMMAYFTFCFAMGFQPWKARDPASDKFVGLGAFNLVRRARYLSLGGHERIRLRPDDDLRLGQLVKIEGGRSDLLFGEGRVRVEWYRTFGELFRGLEKNTFSGADYSLAKMAAMFCATALLHIFPFVYLFVATSMYQWALYGAIVAAWGVASLDNNRFHRLPSWSAYLFPISAFLMLVIMGHATFKTLWIGGIRWRGTFYPLKELRSNALPKKT